MKRNCFRINFAAEFRKSQSLFSFSARLHVFKITSGEKLPLVHVSKLAWKNMTIKKKVFARQTLEIFSNFPSGVHAKSQQQRKRRKNWFDVSCIRLSIRRSWDSRWCSFTRKIDKIKFIELFSRISMHFHRFWLLYFVKMTNTQWSSLPFHWIRVERQTNLK